MTDENLTKQGGSGAGRAGTVAAAPLPLVTLGDPQAAACEGDFCVVPEHPTHAVVARRLDDDAV